MDILLIEDNVVDVELFNEYINEYDHQYQISTISRLHEAIEFIKDHPQIDLILLDLNLPDSNGIATFERIIEIHGEIPVIVLTGMNDQLVAKETIQKGAGDYLVKNELSPYIIHKSINHTIEREKTKRMLIEKDRLVLQSQKMEAIGRLAGGIAHDFNNLITIISGYSEFLMEEAKELEYDKKFESGLQEIIRASNSGKNLIDQLLTFCRQKEITLDILNINKIIDDTLSLLNRITPENIDVEFKIDDQPFIIRFNQTQFEQIIINLVVNAIDAIEMKSQKSTGSIKIIINKIDGKLIDNTSFSKNENLTYIVLSVSDDGIGMDEELQKKVFEPFFTTKDIGKGTGLGLATVYGLVNDNNGHVEIKSETNVGTTFRIYIPEYEIQERDSYTQNLENISNGHLPVDNLSNYNILVVEDDQSLQGLMYLLLKNLGCNVDCFSNGVEVIEYLKKSKNNQHKIDLVVTDIVMPKMQGTEIYYWIKDNLDDKIPFLFISGYNKKSLEISNLAMSENIEFLQKPFETAQFNNIIRQLLALPDF